MPKLTGGYGAGAGKPHFAPKPKPKPKRDVSRSAAAGGPLYSSKEASTAKARTEATRANRPDKNPSYLMRSLMGAPEGRPLRYFGTGRPAPRDSVKNVSLAALGTNGSKPVFEFLSRQRQQAQAQDHDSGGIFGGKHGKDILGAPDANTAKFDKELAKNPTFKALTNDPVHGTNNVMMASAFGLPVGGQAADKYVADVIDAAKSGFDPKQAPGLVLGPENATNISYLQGIARAKGYSQDDINRMNFGELIGAVVANRNKYTTLWHGPGGRAIPTLVRNIPGSGARAIIGFPQQAMLFGAAAGQDLHDTINNIIHGNVRDDPFSLKYTKAVGRTAAKSLWDQSKFIATHPVEAAQTDPVGTALFGYGALHGGTGVLGRVFKANTKREFALGHYDNRGEEFIPTETPQPNGPITIPPSEPRPASPQFGPRPALDPGAGPERRGQPYVNPDAGDLELPAAPNARPAGGVPERVHEAGAPPQRPGLENPEIKRRRIESAKQEQQRLRAHNERLQEDRRNLGNEKDWTDEIESLQKQKDDLDTWLPDERPKGEDGLSWDHRENLKQRIEAYKGVVARRRKLSKTYKDKIRENKNRINELDDEIVGHHIDIHGKLPLGEDFSQQLKRAQMTLDAAIARNAPEAEIARLTERRDHLARAEKDRPSADFIESTRHTEPRWFAGLEDELPITAHLADAVEAKYEAERFHVHDTHHSNGLMNDLTEALNELTDDALGHGAPLSELAHELEPIVEKHFGKNWREKGYDSLTSHSKKKGAAFISDAADVVKRNADRLEEEHMQPPPPIVEEGPLSPEDLSLRQFPQQPQSDRGPDLGQDADIIRPDFGRRPEPTPPTEPEVPPADFSGEARATGSAGADELKGLSDKKFPKLKKGDRDPYSYIHDILESWQQRRGRGSTVRDVEKRIVQKIQDGLEAWNAGPDELALGDSETNAAVRDLIDKHFPDNGFTMDLGGKYGNFLKRDGSPNASMRTQIRAFLDEAVDTVRGIEESRDRPTYGPNRLTLPNEPQPGETGYVPPTTEGQELAPAEQPGELVPHRAAPFWEKPNEFRGRELPGKGTDLVTVEHYPTGSSARFQKPLMVDRGYYSTNLIDRMFEWNSDRRLKSTKDRHKRRQARFLRKEYDVEQGHFRRAFYNWRDDLNPLVQSAQKLTNEERTAIVQAHAQGVLPSHMLDMYEALKRMELDKLKKINFPKKLKQALRDRAPTAQTLRAAQKVVDDAAKSNPDYEPLATWFRDYVEKVNKGDYLDDQLFGNIVQNFYRNSIDLDANINLWRKVVDSVGDDISPEMADTLDKMRQVSSHIDDELDKNGVIPRDIMDDRRFQRQRIVSSITGKHIPLDDKAIYVPDRSIPPRFGEYLFRRTRTYDARKEFGGRLKQHSGRALMSGRVDPSFASYYTGVTSAMSKLDAIKFQRKMLDTYGHKVPLNQINYDANDFVLYNGRTGVPQKQILTRAVIDELHQRMGGEPLSWLENEQRVRFRDERNPGQYGLTDLSPEDIVSRNQGDLYLVPRPIYDRMAQNVSQAQFKHLVPRMMQRYTVGFRTIALKLRPAYLPVNTAESAYRAMYYGGVNPITVAMDTAAHFGRGLAGKLGVPESVRERGPKSLHQRAQTRIHEFIPPHIRRTTFTGNIIKNPKLGSVEPRSMRHTRENVSDMLTRLDRSPVFGPTMKVARFVAGGYGDHIFSATARAENYLRESMILQKQFRAARHQRYGIFDPRHYGIFKRMDDDMMNAMKKIADGTDETGGAAMDRIVNEVGKVLGDFSGAENKYIQLAVPFYRWTAFITKFVLWEAPTKYPGRTYLMHALGNLGYHQLAAMGMLPANFQGAYPVSKAKDEQSDVPGEMTNKILKVMYTQAWNGPSTVVNLFGINPATGELGLGSGAMRQVNPFLQSIYAGARLSDPSSGRELRNAAGQPLNHDFDMMRVFVADNIKALWPVMTGSGYDYSKMADNAIPIFDQIFNPGEFEKKPSKYNQPQSSMAEQGAAALFGTRRRPINLTRLQQQNIDLAMDAARSMYASLGDKQSRETGIPNKRQQHFQETYMKYWAEQTQFIADWMQAYGPEVFDNAAQQ